MTAEKILAAMADAYARCESYCDSGSVRTQFLHSDGSLDFVKREPFETTFVRPNRFRFESSSHHPNLTEYHRYVISAEGGLVLVGLEARGQATR